MQDVYIYYFINNRCEEIIKEILIKTDNEKFYSFD